MERSVQLKCFVVDTSLPQHDDSVEDQVLAAWPKPSSQQASQEYGLVRLACAGVAVCHSFTEVRRGLGTSMHWRRRKANTQACESIERLERDATGDLLEHGSVCCRSAAATSRSSGGRWSSRSRSHTFCGSCKPPRNMAKCRCARSAPWTCCAACTASSACSIRLLRTPRPRAACSAARPCSLHSCATTCPPSKARPPACGQT